MDLAKNAQNIILFILMVNNVFHVDVVLMKSAMLMEHAVFVKISILLFHQEKTVTELA